MKPNLLGGLKSDKSQLVKGSASIFSMRGRLGVLTIFPLFIHELFMSGNPDLVRRKYETHIASAIISDALEIYEKFRAHPLMQEVEEEHSELPLHARFEG